MQAISRLARRQRYLPIVIVSIILTALFLPAAAAQDPAITSTDSHAKKHQAGRASEDSGLNKIAPIRTAELLVGFKSGASDETISQIKKSAGVAKTLMTIGPNGNESIHVVKLSRDMSTNNAINRLKSFPEVIFAEENHRELKRFIPNDTYFLPNQWGLYNYGQTIWGSAGTNDADIDADLGWDLETGMSNPVAVAVIDSGIDFSHPDLDANIWQNPDENTGNHIDDDSNGYIDDAQGYNWAGISQYGYTDYWDFGDIGSRATLAQSITGTGQTLTHIGLLLSKKGNPPGNIMVSVRSSLYGNDLASFTIYPGDVSASVIDEIYKPLSQPVTLIDGEVYYLVFKVTALSYPNYYELYDNLADDTYDTYRGGCEHQYENGSWYDYDGDDFYFRTNPNPRAIDDEGHGTHVSGIIAAEANNNQGIAGISFGASIMPLKVMDCAGYAYVDDTVSAIYYAADNGAKVINMSLGSSQYSAAEQVAINYAYSKGVVVCGANSQNRTSSVGYPEGYANVIGVGSVTNRGLWDGYSNYNSYVDVCAPGEDIYSTMPTYPVGANSLGMAQWYEYSTGTSMACPHAAGAAAVIMSRNPELTPDQVAAIMTQNVDDLGALGRDNYYGYGRVNLFKALSATIVPDHTAPVTTLTTFPMAADGRDGWFITSPVLTLSVNENANTWYSWSLTDSWLKYSSPLAMSLEGVKNLYFYSQDGAGNDEDFKYEIIKYDNTAPAVFDLLPASGNISGKSKPMITAAIDESISGLDGVQLFLDGNMVLDGSSNAISFRPDNSLADGSHTVSLRAWDNAGNIRVIEWIFKVLSGDASGDGHVSFSDFIILAVNYNTNSDNTNWDSRADFNSDGRVDFSDFIILAVNYESSS